MTFKQGVVGVAVVCGLLSSLAQAGVTKADWGKTADGTPVQIYTLSNENLTVRITTFGARVVSIEAPDRTGKKADVVLGYDNVPGMRRTRAHTSGRSWGAMGIALRRVRSRSMARRIMCR